MSTTSGGDTTAHKMQDSSVTTVYNGDRTVTGQRVSPPSSSNGDSGLDNSNTESSAGDAKLIIDVPDFSNEMETSRTGIDNPSFETDKTDVTKSLTNGHNGTVIQENGRHEKDKMAEAVNLELINMKPFAKSMNGKENGVPTKKKETAVNMNDTYDDYFIPVNEHKKYIRGGEKLYVTKDKRDLNQSKKPFMCWVFGLVLLAAAVIVAILASTGIIFNNETAMESRNFMENEKIAGFGNHHVQYSSSVTPPPSSVYSSSPFSPPTTDMSEVYVPRTVQGELAIDNLDFTPGLGNKSSSEFEELAHSIESELKNALFTSNSASDAIRVKVIEFSSGSIVAKYRIGWDYKDDSEPQDVIDAETLKSRLDNYLQENHGHLYNYRVPIHRLRSEPITDKCKTENGKCSHYCSYDYSRLDFVCSCPSELTLSKNLKDCRRIDDNSDDMDDFVFSNHENDQKPNDEDTFLELEPSTEPEGKSELESEVPDDSEPRIEPEAKAEPEPSSIPEDNAASEPSSIPEDNAEPEPKSEPGAKAEPEPSSIPEASAEPEPSSIAPETIAEPVPNSEPSANAEPEPSSVPEGSAEPEPSIPPGTNVEPEPSVKVEPEPSSIPEVSAEPEPSIPPGTHVEPEPSVKVEPEPSSLPEVSAEPEPSISPETKSEPEPSITPETKSEPEPSVVPNSKVVPEPSTKAEPEPSSEPGAKAEPSVIPETKAEPSIIPETKTEPEPSSEPNSKAEPEPEVSAEPEPGAKSEPEPSSKLEIKTELESVAKTEVNSNPEPEPSAEPNSNSSPVEDYKSLSDVDISSDFISAEQDVKPFKSSTEKSISIMDQSDREAKSHSDDIFNQEIKPEVTYSVSTESEFETKTESVSEENSKSKEEHSFSLGDIILNGSEESTTLPTITENWLSTLSSNQGIPKLPNDLEVSNKENGAVEEEIKTESSFIAGQIESKSENKSTTDLITETQSEQLTELPDKSISDNSKDISDIVTASTIDTSSTTREDISLSSNEFENIDKEHVTEMIDITTIMPSILKQVSTISTIDSNPSEIEHSDDLSSFEKTNIPEPTKKLQSLTSLEEQITSLSPINIVSTSTQSVIENLNENGSAEEQDSLDNIMTQQINEQNIADTVNEDEQTSALDFHQKPELKKKEKKTSKNPDIYLSDTGFTKRNKTKTEKEKENKKNNKSDNIESMLEMFNMSKCEEGLFQCLNGTTKDGSYCIPMPLRCNTNKDCTDNSDEYDCFENACSGNFQCKSGECLQRNLVCNNIVDCEDGSDEQSCDLWKCADDEKQCNGGQCLPSFNFCDGKSDCNDHSDELQCNSTCNGFQCSNGYCISSTLQCNGVNDCTGGEDEQNCECNADEFKCNTGSECIPKTQVCDSVAQCTDRSDEWQCVQLDGTQLLAKKEGEIAMKVCSTNWSDQWSNFVCQSLGFTETKTTNFRASESAETPISYLRLKDESTLISSKSLVEYLEVSSTSCDTIEIKCSSKHLCGDFGGKDPLSMDLWPSVIYLYNTKTQKSCTSSLIKRNRLLSSYSCLKTIDESLSPDQWEAISSRTRVANESNLIKKSVSRIISHPGVKYEKLRYLNDTVLVELSTPYDLSDEVNTICLPEKVVDNKQPCVTASWSYESPGVFKQFSRILSDPLMQTDVCNSTKQFNGFLTEREICVASGEMEANNMEIGSPLMCLAENGLWELQGMLSYRGGYGRSSKPSLYNPVVDAVPWAENTIAAGV